MRVDVLGTEYEILFLSREEDVFLKESDGYCDKSTKKIVVSTTNEELGDFETYKKKIVRHEIIHAFMFESGLDCNWQHAEQWGHDETHVDWFAIQAPKLFDAFKTANAIYESLLKSAEIKAGSL